MMTTARNYIQCFSTSCVICRHVTKFCENLAHPPNEWRKLSQSDYCSIMLHVLRKLPYDRRRKAYRLSQMIGIHFNILLSSFQFAVVQRCPVSRALYRSLNLHPTTTLFPKVSRDPIVAHSPLLKFKTPHISKFSWS